MSLRVVAAAPLIPLARDITACPTSPADHAQLGPLLTRTEIHQNQPSALLPHHVLSLDVSMDQTGVVHGRQSSTELVPDESGLAGTERAVTDKHLLERHPAHELHPEADPTIVFAGSVNGDDIRMTDASQRLPFVQQPRCELLVGRGGTPQELDGDGSIELRVVGAIDGAERALADFLDQDEFAPSLRDRRRASPGSLVSRVCPSLWILGPAPAD